MNLALQVKTSYSLLESLNDITKLVLKAKEDSEAFIKNKEYLKIENKHIIDLVKSSSKIS